MSGSRRSLIRSRAERIRSEAYRGGEFTQEHAPFEVSLDILCLSLADAPPHNVFVLCDDIFPFGYVLEEGLGGSIDGRRNNGEFGRHGPQLFSSVRVTVATIDDDIKPPNSEISRFPQMTDRHLTWLLLPLSPKAPRRCRSSPKTCYATDSCLGHFISKSTC